MARTKSQAMRRSGDLRTMSPLKKGKLYAAKKLMRSHPALDTELTNKKQKKSKLKTPDQGVGSNSLKTLKSIKDLQKSTRLLIPKAAFGRVVREVLKAYAGQDLRITAEALGALHESAECFLVQFLNDSYLLSLHAKRITLYPTDMTLLRRLRGRNDPCN